MTKQHNGQSITIAGYSSLEEKKKFMENNETSNINEMF